MYHPYPYSWAEYLMLMSAVSARDLSCITSNINLCYCFTYVKVHSHFHHHCRVTLYVLLITVKICLSLLAHFSYLGIHVLDKRSFCIMIWFSLLFCLFYQQIRHVIASSAGTHQHNYNHVGLSSPTRTPKNGKDHSSPFSSHSFRDKYNLSVYHDNDGHATKTLLCLSLPFFFFFSEMCDF